MKSATLVKPEDEVRNEQSDAHATAETPVVESAVQPASAADDLAAETDPTADLSVEAGSEETNGDTDAETGDEGEYTTTLGEDGAPEGPPPEPEPHPERAAALAPFMSKLHQLLGNHRELDRSSQVNIGENSLQVTTWERDLTLEILDGEAGGKPGWIRRVAESIAFQTKIMVDLDRYARAADAPDDVRERVLHDLYLGAAVGSALYVELQKVVDKMVLSREMDLAMRLTQLRNRVRVAQKWLNDVLDEDTLARAEALAEEFVCIPSDAVLPDPKKRKRRRRRSSEYTAEPQVVIRSGGLDRDRRRIRLMAVSLLALTVTWAYFILMPSLSQKKIPELTIRDFRTVTEIQSVRAVPPSLYITISEHDWEDLGESGKQWVVDASSRIAAGAGYSGAVFYTSDGETVAQWLQKRGTKVFEPQPDPRQ